MNKQKRTLTLLPDTTVHRILDNSETLSLKGDADGHKYVLAAKPAREHKNT